MIVAEYIANFLVDRDVRHVFGLQGGAILKLVDEMVATGKIQYVQNYHEQASAFCADAYSRVTGSLGVALATSGPGATNLITGIANAYLDSIPTLFITGQEYSSRLQKKNGVRSNGFQDLDIVSVVKPITKHAVTLTDGRLAAYEMERAIHFATSGRPGPVLLDIPIDIQFQKMNADEIEHFAPQNQSAGFEKRSVMKLVEMLRTAKRPVILGGGGINIAQARNALKALAERSGIPVALTLNGLDVYGDSIGFSGLYGNVATSLAVYNADLLIVLGARLGQHQVGKSKEGYTRAKVVHVDIDDLELERCMPEELSIRADVKAFAQALEEELRDARLPSYADWQKRIAAWQNTYPLDFGPQDKGASPIRVVSEIQRHLDDDTVIASDVGQNQMWVAQSLKPRGNQRLLNSSGLGSMGYSLPAAIAAKLCRPNSKVVALMGDGGFQINMQELQLVALRKLDIKIFIFNNQTLGLIKTAQDKYFGARYHGAVAPDYGCVDLGGVAAAYGMRYYRMSTAADLGVLSEIFASDQPCLVEIKVDPDFPLQTRHDMAAIIERERTDA